MGTSSVPLSADNARRGYLQFCQVRSLDGARLRKKIMPRVTVLIKARPRSGAAQVFKKNFLALTSTTDTTYQAMRNCGARNRQSLKKKDFRCKKKGGFHEKNLEKPPKTKKKLFKIV